MGAIKEEVTVTPFGKLLRRERQDRNLLLGDLAKLLGISTPYLSQLETGQRFVPDGFEDKVINALSLTQNDANELIRAAAVSRGEFRISLDKDATIEDRSLASDLAESFARLTPEAKAQLRKMLKGGQNG